MPAYAIAHVRAITMGPAVVEYVNRIDATLVPFGGRFVIHGGNAEVLEGTWRGLDLARLRLVCVSKRLQMRESARHAAGLD
jgi:uncharacterized protein (DUF1330 family)